MATRTGIFGPFIALTKWRAAHVNEIPDGWIGDESAAGISGVGPTADDLVSVTVVLAAARRLKVSVTASLSNGGTSTGGTITVFEGATSLGRVHRHPDGVDESYCAGFVTFDAAVGTHTYKAVGDTTTNSYDIFGDTQILVEVIGPASA